MDDMTKASEELAKVAADEGTTQAQAKKSHATVKASCTDCHNVFRVEENRPRAKRSAISDQSENAVRFRDRPHYGTGIGSESYLPLRLKADFAERRFSLGGPRWPAGGSRWPPPAGAGATPRCRGSGRW